MDLLSGFWQVIIKPEHRKKTAFDHRAPDPLQPPVRPAAHVQGDQGTREHDRPPPYHGRPSSSGGLRDARTHRRCAAPASGCSPISSRWCATPCIKTANSSLPRTRARAIRRLAPSAGERSTGVCGRAARVAGADPRPCGRPPSELRSKTSYTPFVEAGGLGRARKCSVLNSHRFSTSSTSLSSRERHPVGTWQEVKLGEIAETRLGKMLSTKAKTGVWLSPIPQK